MGGVLVGFVEQSLDDRRERVGFDLLVAGDGRAQTHVLNGPHESVDYRHGEVDVLLPVEEAVVVIAQIVEELAGVPVDDGR